MSYKVFLLEKETGCQVFADSNGLKLMESLNMLDRYWTEQNNANNDGKSGKSGTSKTGNNKGKGLLK